MLNRLIGLRKGSAQTYRPQMTETESPRFTVAARDEGDTVRIDVTGPGGKSHSYLLEGRESRHYFEFFRRLHQDFGTRLPHFFVDRRDFSDTPSSWQPLLTDNVSPKILAGYGDPAVLKTESGYYLLATSKLAQTTLRSVLGQVELDELLSARDVINHKLQSILDAATESWA